MVLSSSRRGVFRQSSAALLSARPKSKPPGCIGWSKVRLSTMIPGATSWPAAGKDFTSLGASVLGNTVTGET